ncbi:hypothetical protein KY289_015471 [Solanum tuberosum]|nr:hypothetical protein KY289_015471 [Solanum tuberosum]
MTIKEKQVSCRSPGYAPVPPSYSQVASSANVLSNGERALSANDLGIPKAQLEAH